MEGTQPVEAIIIAIIYSSADIYFDKRWWIWCPTNSLVYEDMRIE